MRKKIFFAILIMLFAFFLLSFGCLEKTQKLGCCAKQNATADGLCYYYNMTTESYVDLYGKTKSCDIGTGYCNVTINSKETVLPICSDDMLVQCLKPECTAMICGDFKYKPKIAPGVASEENLNEMVPVTDEDDTMQGLYAAQCRFYPMDSKLKTRMRTSNAQINKFRFGVGGSFNEFDIYQSYFPISDKYCAINPLGKIDRYMNYIDSSKKEFDPISGIEENCIDDTNILGPFTFGSSYYFSLVEPERSSYKYADSYKSTAKISGYYSFFFGYSIKPKVGKPAITQIYKKLDRTFYRKQLAIIYAKDFYAADASRAPFECNTQSNDCLSGYCKDDFYSRGANIVKDKDGNEIEVATDCNTGIGPDGRTWTFCMPTKSVSFSSTPGNPPTQTFAQISVKPWKFSTAPTRHSSSALYDKTFDVDYNHPFDQIYFDNPTWSKNWYPISTLPDSLNWEKKKAKDCADEPTSTDPEKEVQCPPDMSGTGYPPAGQIVFFNRDDIFYNKEKIIGYAVVDPNEFKNTLFANNCGLFEPITIVFNYTSTEYFGSDEEGECESLCTGKCGSGATAKCSKHCKEKVTLKNKSADSPCSYTEQMEPNPNFILIELDPTEYNSSGGKDEASPKHAVWEKLTAAFKPIHKDRMTYLGGQGWNKGDNSDLLWSSMFWVPGYTGIAREQDQFFWSTDGHQKPYYLSGAGVANAMEKNIYDRNTPDADIPDATALMYGTINHPNNFPIYEYQSLWPKYVLLLKSHTWEGKEMIGNCELRNNAPVIRQYGWCEPCTVNSLAYQEVKTTTNPYIPVSEISTETGETTELCKYVKEESGNFYERIITYDIKCNAPHIPNLNDYDDSNPALSGAPRTIPEASLMKERIGNYLKAGIMPVIDLTDDSNWNLTSTYPTALDIGFFSTDTTNQFEEYDFQRMLGNDGAMVVIVDAAWSDPVSQAEIDQIMKRASAVKSYCWRCLTAVDVPATDNKSFSNKVKQLFSDPRMGINIDVITNSYSTSKLDYLSSDTEKNSEMVIADLTAYGRGALTGAGKPLLIKSFIVPKISPWANDNDVERLFTNIIEQEDDLVKAGIIGMIYSDTKGNLGLGEGLVEYQFLSAVKTPKFCALQKATALLASSRPMAQFTRTIASESVNCTRCTSLDISMGKCDMNCDNGEKCTLPEGGISGQYKCPDGIVLNECKLCNATFGTFICNITYVNGTVLKNQIYASTDVNSDIYGEIIGGLEKPNKCCLQDSFGTNYTYSKRIIQNILNAPIVYPKSGEQNQDCGISSSGSVAEASQFCGVKLPINNYDIECIFIEKPVTTITAALPEYTIWTPDKMAQIILPP